jgi:hypothetical protein
LRRVVVRAVAVKKAVRDDLIDDFRLEIRSMGGDGTQDQGIHYKQNQRIL